MALGKNGDRKNSMLTAAIPHSLCLTPQASALQAQNIIPAYLVARATTLYQVPKVSTS
jgi:hypothetical protein